MVGGRIGREQVQEQVQMLAASEVALMVLGCIAAELIAALGAERAEVSEVLLLGAVLLAVLVEQDLCDSNTNLYNISWRVVLGKEDIFFCFWFHCCFRCFRCLGVLALPSPFFS